MRIFNGDFSQEHRDVPRQIEFNGIKFGYGIPCAEKNNSTVKWLTIMLNIAVLESYNLLIKVLSFFNNSKHEAFTTFAVLTRGSHYVLNSIIAVYKTQCVFPTLNILHMC